MRYGMTGPRDLVPMGFMRIRRALLSLEEVDEFTSGAQRGADTIAALMSMGLFKGALHRIVRPAAPYDPIWSTAVSAPLFEVIDGPRCATYGQSYMARNGLVLDHSDVLLAFPRTNTEERRSGTWACIREAERRDIPVLKFPLLQEV